MTRLTQPLNNMTLVVVAARLCAVLDNDGDIEAAFLKHLQAMNDWILEFEYSARLARRAKRIKQPGTVAREITKRHQAKPILSPGEESMQRRVINQSKKLGL
jgi:hypothetical protein